MHITAAVERILAENLIRNQGLYGLWEHIRDHNPGNVNLYHNNRHLLTVALWCGKLYSVEESVAIHSPISLKLLICAGLLHDYGHSGGALTDSDNLKTVYEFIDQAAEHRFTSWGRYLMANGDQLKKLISVTEFPFVREPETVEERILRDADLLGTYTDDVAGVILDGLYGERMEAGYSFSKEEIIAQQRNFLSNVTLYTSMANQMRDELLPAIMDQLQASF